MPVQVIERSGGASGTRGRPPARVAGGWRGAAHLVLRLAPQPAMVGWQAAPLSDGPQAGRATFGWRQAGRHSRSVPLPHLRKSVSRSSSDPSAMAAPLPGEASASAALGLPWCFPACPKISSAASDTASSQTRSLVAAQQSQQHVKWVQ